MSPRPATRGGSRSERRFAPTQSVHSDPSLLSVRSRMMRGMASAALIWHQDPLRRAGDQTSAVTLSGYAHGLKPKLGISTLIACCRALGCHAVIGYRESTTICNELCVLSATGTAALLDLTVIEPSAPAAVCVCACVWASLIYLAISDLAFSAPAAVSVCACVCSSFSIWLSPI